MSSHKIKIIGLFILFSSGVIIPNLDLSGLAAESNLLASMFLEEGQLAITGNEDWNNTNWSGNGTEAFPYLVENLTLTEFFVRFSDVFFRIQNCIIDVHADFYSVSNGTIMNSKFNHRVTLSHCSRIQVTNITVRPEEQLGYQDNGLYIYDANEVLVEDCIIDNWGISGLLLETSTNCTIQRTTFSECGMILYTTLLMHIAAQSFSTNGGGLSIATCTSCKILNNSFIDNIGRGFCSGDCVDITISGNYETDNGRSSTISSCRYTLITNNSLPSLTLSKSENCTLYLNKLGLSGLSFIGGLQYYYHNITQNTVVDKPLHYLLDEHEMNYSDAEFGQVFIVNSTKVVLNNVQVNSVINIRYSNNCNVTEVTSSAIVIFNSTNTNVEHSEIRGGSGIYSGYSEETMIHHNMIIDTERGISISYESNNSRIYSNQIVNAIRDGITINSHMIRIENNTITESAVTQYNAHWNDYFYYAGIRIYSDDCIIMNNTATDNHGYGIMVVGNNNTLFLNYLARNEEGNGLSQGENNQWDNGVDTGNYWDDWIGFGVYTVPGVERALDRFPMGPTNGEFPLFETVLVIAISILIVVGIALFGRFWSKRR